MAFFFRLHAQCRDSRHRWLTACQYAGFSRTSIRFAALIAAWLVGAGLSGGICGGAGLADPATTNAVSPPAGFELRHGSGPLSLENAGYSVAHWTVEDGLPMQNVTSLAQTPDGFLWCGTFDGLARFDGVEFKIYFPHEVPELKGMRIVALTSDKDGRLWILDADGRLVVHENGRFQSMEAEAGSPGARVGGMWRDASGAMWFRDVQGKQFYYFHSNQFEKVSIRVPEDRGLAEIQAGRNGALWAITHGERALMRLARGSVSEQPIRGLDGSTEDLGNLFRLADGNLALSSRRGIFVQTNGGWTCFHNFDTPVSRGDLVCGCQDRQGNFWIGTAGGGLVLSLANGRTGRVTLPGESTRPFIRDLLVDDEGNVWIASGAGIYRIRHNPIVTWSDSSGSLRGGVRSLAEDKDHRLWVVQDNRVGWLASGTNRLFEPSFDVAGRTLFCAAPARDGSVWLAAGINDGKSSEIWKLTPAESRRIGQIECETVEVIHESQAGMLWIGTSAGLFRRERDRFVRSRLPLPTEDTAVVAVAEDRVGNLYAAVSGAGLYRLERRGWRRLTERDDAGSDRIQALYFDSDDVLWIAADRPALARWKDEHWTEFRGLDPELPRKARALAADDQYGLWLTSRWGLVRVNRLELNDWANRGDEDVNSTWFDREDGLASIECASSQSGICKDSEGRIWVATARGISVIDPDAWEERRATEQPPQVHILQALLDDMPVRLKPTNDNAPGHSQFQVVLPPGSQRIEIQYTGVDLSAPEKVRFRYRLEHFDDEWVNAGDARSVHFTRLPPGRYPFQVIAANNDGVWNYAGDSLLLVVQPAWWQRTSVRAASGLLLLGVIWLGSYVQIRRLQAQRVMQSEFSRQLIRSQELERKRIAGELHDSLGQNLLVAKNLALLGENAGAGNTDSVKQFREISNAVSAALNEARDISRALRPPELDRMGLTKALRGMLQRAGESAGIECVVTMDDIDGLLPAAEEINVYRLAQEAMNNVVKHSGASRVEIELQHLPDHLWLRIADNGRGFDAAKVRATEPSHGGTGLVGMDERTRLAGGEFEVISQPGSGTTVNIRIPVSAPKT